MQPDSMLDRPQTLNGTPNNLLNTTTSSVPTTFTAVPVEFGIIDGFSVTLGMLSFLMNTTNLIILWTNNQAESIFRRCMCYFVTNLAIADLWTGVNSVLWGIRSVTGFYPKDILFTMNWITVQVSFLTILAMAVDRYIAVSYPMTNETIISSRRTLLGCAFIWAVSISIGILIYYKLNVGKFIFCALFQLNIAVVVVIYILMYRKVRVISKLAHDGQVRNKDTIRKATLDLRVFSVVFLLVGILVVTVLPYVTALQIELGYLIFSPESGANKTLGKFLDYYFPVQLVNFLANPIVYTWRLPNYRKALLKIFCGKR